MKFGFRFSVGAWLLAHSVALSPAANVTNLFNTGVDASGAPLPAGAVDPHWQLVTSADTNAPGPNAFVVANTGFPIPPWLAQGPHSQWIAPLTDQQTGNAPGNYHYRTRFELSGFNSATAVLRLIVASDNPVTAVLLNGQVTGLTFSNGFTSWSSNQITTGFQSGTNTLELVVMNEGGPTGFRCELSATADLMWIAEENLVWEKEGTNLALSWTTNLPCYLLESTTNLGSGVWTNHSSLPAISNGRLRLAVPAHANERFFRLRRQSSATLPTPKILVNGHWGCAPGELDCPAEWVQYGCQSSLGCPISALLAEMPNQFDASYSIDWARCSTNDPGMRFQWQIYYPPEAGGMAYTSSLIPERTNAVLVLPANCLPQLIPTTRMWTVQLTMTSQVDPLLSTTIHFQVRYTGSELLP